MNSRLTIQDIAAILADKTGKDKESMERFLKILVATISESVVADRLIKVKGLGTFKIIRVENRESIDVNTGTRFLIPAHYKFSFLPDKELRELVNRPFSFFETTEISGNTDFPDIVVSKESDTDIDTDNMDEDDSEEEERLEKKSIVSEGKPAITETPDITEEQVWLENEQPQREEQLLSQPDEERIIPEKKEILSESPVSPTKVEDSPIETNIIASSGFHKKMVYRGRRRHNNVWKILCIILSVIIVLMVAAFAYLNSDAVLKRAHRQFYRTDQNLINQKVPVSEPADTIKNSDQTVDTAAQSLKKEETKIETPNVNELKTESAKSVLTESTGVSDVIANVKIESGIRLTLISLKYYGDKVFWVYLYEYNKEKIKNPNNIPIGVVIKVPAPSVYGIDKANAASVKKASDKQAEILGRK
ncbi:MAG: HU family DNA-binding protein [Parabacteroides sp.]|nr:HU family DNA-binding protein [Parabacteroides sp.]